MSSPSYSYNNEPLPVYTPALVYYDLAWLKRELTSPFNISRNRNWIPVIVEINSTQLNIYKVKAFPENIIDTRQYIVNNIGPRLESFTLQNCRIGLATDYGKTQMAIRLRVELNQLLFSFRDVFKCTLFYYNATVGINLASPYEARKLPMISRITTEILTERDSVQELPVSLIEKSPILSTFPGEYSGVSSSHSSASSIFSFNSKTSSFSSCSTTATTTTDLSSDLMEFFSNIPSLESKCPWQGEVTVTGDFHSTKINKLIRASDKEKYIEGTSILKFLKLIKSTSLRDKTQITCKTFTLQGFQVFLTEE